MRTLARHAVVLALLPVSLWMAPAKAQDVDAMEDARLTPLRLVEHVGVLVEDLTPDAERAAVTREAIAAEATARLRVARLDVTREEAVPPLLYFQVSVLCNTGSVCAIDVSSAIVQDVYLLQGVTRTSRAKTWSTGRLLIAPRALVAERVRDVVREQTDLFTADVLAARERFSSAMRGSALKGSETSVPAR